MQTKLGLDDQRQRDLALALGAFIVAVILWQIQGAALFVYPFRLFVTMIHELGHGLSAVLTGGSFVEFQVKKNGAGLALTRGGTRFVIIQAGYLGAAVFGAALLFLTHRVKQPGRVAIGVGILIGGLTVLYSGLSLYKLGAVETVLAAAILIAGGWLLLTRETDEGRYAGAAVLVAGSLLALVFAGSGNLLTIIVGLGSAAVLVVIGVRGSRDVIVVTLTFLAFLTGLQAITDAWILLKIVSLPASLMPNNDA
ncbi:MAG: M50 family metallopeptidase, partial [Anaerolineae bacterium]|nr:M50 family metallopeptidase [Anaerolineae bacterium]